MESVVNLLFSEENVRMLILLVSGFCGYVLVRSQMKGLEYSLSKRMDGLDHKIDGVDTSLNHKIDALDRKIDGVDTSLNHKIDALDRKIDGVDTSLNHKINGLETSLNHKIDNLEFSLLKAMDEKIAAANQNLYAQLKANDFKHLNDTIEALTFMLEKNEFLSIEDKTYIDGRLDK